MEQPNQFRTAFNGFNREDVVRYLEYINHKHSAQVAQLNSELEYLRRKQNTPAAAHAEQLGQKLDELQEENDSLRQRIAQLESQLEHQPEVKPVSSIPNMEELEAYRRAERVERVAKERAGQIGQQTTAILDEASEKISGASAQISQVSNVVLEQLSQLKSAMDASQQAFRDASRVVARLQAEIEE